MHIMPCAVTQQVRLDSLSLLQNFYESNSISELWMHLRISFHMQIRPNLSQNSYNISAINVTMIGSGLVQFTELNHFIGFSFFGDYSKYSDKIATVLITAVKYTPEHTVDYIKWTIEM